MKTRLVMVSSLDGKTTKWDSSNLSDWTSPEDQEYFAKLLSQSKLIIMGRNTYEEAKEGFKLSEDKLRIVLTSTPEMYSTVAVMGQLEFWDELPIEAIQKLEEKGFTEATLVGGSEINSAFLGEDLIDEIWLTVEPIILGSGKVLFAEQEFDKKVRLLHSERLNESGTLLLKYEVL